MDELNKRDLGLKRQLTAIEQALDVFAKLVEEQVSKHVAGLQAETANNPCRPSNNKGETAGVSVEETDSGYDFGGSKN